ncbi:MAG: PIN domain-containing protein [Planctomycetia bacterium]|nr:PIN domain-containing protein [Planctomycetia bacterium]
MIRRLFGDTSAIVALFDHRDAHHATVKALLEELRGRSTHFTTTTDVFDETVTLLRGRVGHAMAVSAGEYLRAGCVWRVRPVDAAVREEAWALFRRYGDHRFSLTDCTSFVTMSRFRIATALTLDADFRAMGFEVLPEA